MKIFYGILIALVGLVAVVLITALFVKKEYSVVREISISKPKEEVFAYIKFLKNQDNFSKWAKMDTNMTKEYTGTDGTIGFTSAWNSQNEQVGAGSQTIKAIIEGEKLDIALHFIKPFEGFANAYFQTTAISENETKVVWGLNSSMPYPMNLMLLFINMDEMIGNDLSTGLSNLKSVLEK